MGIDGRSWIRPFTREQHCDYTWADFSHILSWERSPCSDTSLSGFTSACQHKPLCADWAGDGLIDSAWIVNKDSWIPTKYQTLCFLLSFKIEEVLENRCGRSGTMRLKAVILWQSPSLQWPLSRNKVMLRFFYDSGIFLFSSNARISNWK